MLSKTTLTTTTTTTEPPQISLLTTTPPAPSSLITTTTTTAITLPTETTTITPTTTTGPSKPIRGSPQSLTAADASSNESNTNSWPSFWSKKQWNYFCEENTWLIAKNKSIGCSVCAWVQCLGPNKCGHGLKNQLSEEWINASVHAYGSDKSKQQKSLRKKIYIHRDSIGHVEAKKVKAKADECLLMTSVINQQQEEFASTCNVFRTAYYLATNDRPYLDHAELIELQRMNGVDVGRVLHSNVVAADIIDHISSTMKQRIIDSIISNSTPISVSIDESTTVSSKSCLIIYLRCCPLPGGEPVNLFLDLVELANADAVGICAALMKSLSAHGFSDEILAKCWLGLASDGASVMLGRKGGVAALLKERFPSIIGWHCFNHRLELSVHDAVKSCTEINAFKIFMEKLYSLYSMSPKNRRYLETCASDLNVELLKIGKILDVRWVSSSFRTVKAVFLSYSALFEHFSRASVDYAFDSKERAQYSGLASKLQNTVFLTNLALMHDALEELADLSESLQTESITLPKALRLLERQIEVFCARKVTDCGKYKDIFEAAKLGRFRNVSLLPGSARDKKIDKAQFYQALVDSLISRLFSESDKPVSECVSNLIPSSWPSELSPEYGEESLKEACTKFLIPYSPELKQSYRDYKDSKGNNVTYPMKCLLSAIATLPISTAECERGFSRMNIICCPLRNSLKVQHISSLIFMSNVAPPLSKFVPAPYVYSWLANGRRDANCSQGMESKSRGGRPSAKESLWALL